MAQTEDERGIKKEYEEGQDVDEHWKGIKVKMENMDEMENLAFTEIDIGPIKIELGAESEAAEQEEELLKNAGIAPRPTVPALRQDVPTVRGQLPPATKSNNRRIVVRELQQRLMKLDRAIVPGKWSNVKPRPAPAPPTSRMQRLHRKELNTKTRKQMRDLRQRLMNLEQPEKQPAKTISKRLLQLDFRERLLKLDKSNQIDGKSIKKAD